MAIIFPFRYSPREAAYIEPALASAEQFIKVGNIIRTDKDRRYVVPSAPGKRFSDDTKVTDLLYSCYELGDIGAAAGKSNYFAICRSAVKSGNNSNEIIHGLHLKFSLDDDFDTIKKKFLDKAGSMYAASRGEYLNGKQRTAAEFDYFFHETSLPI